MPNPEPELAALPSAGITIDARLQDQYWCGAYAAEGYVRPGLDYEDYAPAYCVGYVGYAQYGAPWEDAERSLWANWERIKGGSRLSWDEARPAIRAAWERVEHEAQRMPVLAPSGAWREPGHEQSHSILPPDGEGMRAQA